MQTTPNYGLKKPDANDTVNIADLNANADTLDSALTPTADPTQVPTGNGPGKLVQWVGWLANRIKAITGKTNWYDAPDITLATLAAHKSRHASGGADALAPADIGAAAASDLAAHLAEIVTTPQANKILRLDANAKLPASITGDAATVAGKSVGNGSGQVPVSNGTVCTNLNSDRVDSIHFRVSNGVLQYSTDGSVWNSVSVIKSIQRGVVESTALGDINVTINSVDTSKAIVIISGDGYGYGTYTVIHSFRYAVLTNSTTLTIKQRFYQSSWGNNSYVSMAWQVVEFY